MTFRERLAAIDRWMKSAEGWAVLSALWFTSILDDLEGAGPHGHLGLPLSLAMFWWCTIEYRKARRAR